MDDKGLYWGVCDCYAWPISGTGPLGPCGYCGEVPTLILPTPGERVRALPLEREA